MECPKSKSGLHEMVFIKREVLGTAPFELYQCKHCGEPLSIEVQPWGKDSKETPTS